MTDNRLGAMPPKRRQALLETAADEFARHGYENASLNRIIRACRMSKSSFYHFVDSKQALFDEVIREAADALLADMEVPEPRAFAGPGFWDHLAELGDRLTRLTVPGSWYVNFGRMFYLADIPASASTPLAQAHAGIQRWVADVLAIGQASGAVRGDLPQSLLISLTLGILRSMDEWSLTSLPDLDGQDRSEMSDLQVDILRRLLSPATPAEMPVNDRDR